MRFETQLVLITWKKSYFKFDCSYKFNKKWTYNKIYSQTRNSITNLNIYYLDNFSSLKMIKQCKWVSSIYLLNQLSINFLFKFFTQKLNTSILHMWNLTRFLTLSRITSNTLPFLSSWRRWPSFVTPLITIKYL